MGLQNQLNDISTESIPILMVTLFANCVNYLRSLIFSFLHFVGFSSSRFPTDQIDDSFCEAVGSGLTGVIFLAEQLNLNRLLSYRHQQRGDGTTGAGSNTCVVCLHRLGDGDRVRKLACRHVFHTECLDGWFNTLNLNCPLCRSTFVSGERVVRARRRVAGDLLAWFSLS
ncbi:Ubiquitin-protein ligase [Datura stramonium]|uniref:Ubiquitin-protein ligase n=1 Tax=Datura stramonium TaxID=4076 RepID=A0ABS8VAK1_DATST|nr:Ubiquitin-protein ligase [Datura stramonium]